MMTENQLADAALIIQDGSVYIQRENGDKLLAEVKRLKAALAVSEAVAAGRADITRVQGDATLKLYNEVTERNERILRLEHRLAELEAGQKPKPTECVRCHRVRHCLTTPTDSGEIKLCGECVLPGDVAFLEG